AGHGVNARIATGDDGNLPSLARLLQGEPAALDFLSQGQGQAFSALDEISHPGEIAGVADDDFSPAQRRQGLWRHQVALARAHANNEYRSLAEHANHRLGPRRLRSFSTTQYHYGKIWQFYATQRCQVPDGSLLRRAYLLNVECLEMPGQAGQLVQEL